MQNGNMATIQFALALVFLVIIVIIYSWDAYMMTSGQINQSVSVLVREWSSKQPILPFAVGVLVGHIFW